MSYQRFCDVGVVIFRPDLDILVNLLANASRAGGNTWIFLNSPLTQDAEIQLRAAVPSGLHFLNDGKNLGLGVGYNRMAEVAHASGARMLLIFDQDSSPDPDMTAQLRTTFELLCAAGERPAVVGPLAVSANSELFKPPRRFRHLTAVSHGSAWPAEFVISSGSLLDLAAFEEIGPFREDFFIDAIDIEWCFRSWARGYSCWIENASLMPHRLGQGTIRLPFVNILLTRQSPSRLYTYVRNQVAMLRLAHIPFRWRLRILPYLSFQTIVYFLTSRHNRWRVLCAISYGLVDGLMLWMGPGNRNLFRE